MDATRTLDDLRSIKEIRPTRRVLDVEAEREGEESDREIERQRMAIRAAKAREEMEEEALRRAEEERELARREEEERRARKQAEIDRERAMRRSVRTIRPEEEEDDSDSLELESLDEGLDLNNLMIEAVNDEDGLAAALDALREIHRELNKRGISAVASRLAGKDLIIEHAAGLSNAVQNELDELMERDKSGMIVVLIDTPENLEALHGNNMSLASKFQYIGADSRAQEKQQNEAALEEALLKQTEVQEKIAQEVVQGREPEPEDGFDGRTEDFRDMSEARREEPPHLEQEEPVREMAAAAPKMAAGAPKEDDLDDSTEMELEEFAQYACKYAADIDCSITGKSMLALYERIEMMEEDGVRLTRKAAVDLIEEAADKAEKPSLGKKITGLFSSKYDKEGHLILREDNFFD